jgi:hypothetical protein
MIKIDKKLAEKCAKIHYEACKPYVESHLNFLIDLFNAASQSKLISFKSTSKFYKERELRTKYKFDRITSIRAFISSITNKEIEYDDIFSVLEKGEFSVFNMSKTQISESLSFFNNIFKQLKTILQGKPKKLSGYLTFKSKDEQERFKGLIEYIFSYEKLGNKDGEAYGSDKNWNTYALTKKLKVNVCPYCNKNWTNTVYDENGDKVTNPQLDHFFSKSDYPILRLSFYNLIPSCETCNARIKKKKELDIENHIHPYLDGFDPEYFFAPIPLDTESTFGVGTNYQITLEEEDTSDKFKRSKNSFNFFHIEDVYEQHGDIISEIYYKRIKYNLTALEDLLKQDMFEGMSIEEAYRFVFANYYSEEDYNKRPFSKLTKDTLRYLELDLFNE